MGLDMYAYRMRQADASANAKKQGFCGNAENLLKIVTWTEGIFGGQCVNTDGKLTQIHYWRKHHDLHGLMQETAEHYGYEGEFNCDFLLLTEEDLDRIEARIKDNSMPETTGFFFGHYPPDEETQEDDLQFITAAREAIKEGDLVYYSSWW
ncbi:hypothetical protein [Alteromonas macleodii]|uniref:Phosphoglycerate kinase n=1 Tax=Alteromonas macleodii TaxID=28108 RepID=A0AB36FMU2_ALTMA|nr:hypothetical protein [Alteromonas macleodii]OES24494.1 putative phosphoglycerate kinase [Alteromonas macleodii]OES25551.1 putative phosphoglycerate kinase [Alteromonas macleodii]OES25852.1 putative phosphoglycerate kinase [Alteromonas macleodii]OES38626.1 putative phosphoglycerate kinase [Alteromonas macleodii]